MSQRGIKITAVVLSFLLGALLDFLVYGVAEIIWFVVYAPIYFAAGSILVTQLAHSRWERVARAAATSMILGLVVARLSLVHLHRKVSYTMNVTQGPSITLRSENWPRTLVISSEKLKADIAGKAPGTTISVAVDVITNYGCISSFVVSTVDGVDIQADRAASWTWRNDSGAPADAIGGPGLEDQQYPWCRIHFYRK
ncbi:MAG: hypothetical protein ACXVCI_06495 [Bdellovibrionota bacterium]